MIKYGIREDRKYQEKGPAIRIGDMKLHLQGGIMHGAIVEISGKGEKTSHRGEELLFCLTGKIELDVNGEIKILNKGDSAIFFRRRTASLYIY